MKTNQEKLFTCILDTVLRIENDLKSVNSTGIFFAPELYLAFEVGKELYKKRIHIFGDNDIEWVRELNLGNGGPSDLILQSENDTYVFEFKIADKWNSYERDIAKLKALKNSGNKSFYKFFVALVDHFPGKKDGRLDFLENSGLTCLGSNSFPTKFSSYKSDINCFLGLYQIDSIA